MDEVDNSTIFSLIRLCMIILPSSTRIGWVYVEIKFMGSLSIQVVAQILREECIYQSNIFCSNFDIIFLIFQSIGYSYAIGLYGSRSKDVFFY